MKPADPIPFNRPFAGAAARAAVMEVLKGETFAGGGRFTRRCLSYFSSRFGFEPAFLTSSCTDALEMCALLLDVKEGDEVIVPSYTYVTSALAFHRQGAKIVFADSCPDHPNLDVGKLPGLLSPRTKAVVVVHYAGVAAQLPELVDFCRVHDLVLIEDAAQAIDAYLLDRPLGSYGHLACLSFHDTKNIHCGEGGLLIVNDAAYSERAQVLLDKGTNRADFRRGLVDKYECVDVGSSFLASELQAAFLFGQLQELDAIQAERMAVWDRYKVAFSSLPIAVKPWIPLTARHNAYCYYLLLPEGMHWSQFAGALAGQGITAVTHYQALHLSPFFSGKRGRQSLPMAEQFTERLIRLPLYHGLTEGDQDRVIAASIQILERSLQ